MSKAKKPAAKAKAAPKKGAEKSAGKKDGHAAPTVDSLVPSSVLARTKNLYTEGGLSGKFYALMPKNKIKGITYKALLAEVAKADLPSTKVKKIIGTMLASKHLTIKS